MDKSVSVLYVYMFYSVNTKYKVVHATQLPK